MKNMERRIIAADLGASGGRVACLAFDGVKLHSEKYAYFKNISIHQNGHYYWDLPKIAANIDSAFNECARDNKIDGISACSWGCDFNAVDMHGRSLGLPFTYRDPMFNGTAHELTRKIGEQRWRRITGMIPEDRYPLCQLYAIKHMKPEIYAAADKILFISDMVHYMLSGECRTDFTHLSYSMAYDTEKRCISEEITSASGIEARLFPLEAPCGSVIGQVSHGAAGVAGAAVSITGGHDTGVVAALYPHDIPECLLLNCGTWAVLGYLSDKPEFTGGVISFGAACGGYFTAECIPGMWLLEECIHEWEAAGVRCAYEALENAAQNSKCDAIIDLSHPSLYTPGSMTDKIRGLAQPGGYSPDSSGDYVRIIYRSLSYRLAKGTRRLSLGSGAKYRHIYFVGGASRSEWLCKLLADFSQCVVITGPSEATMYANACVQLLSLGYIGSFGDIGQIVSESVERRLYLPAVFSS